MKALLEYIYLKEFEMLEFLERLVNIDSGSYDKAGVDQVGDVFGARGGTAEEQFGIWVVIFQKCQCCGQVLRSGYFWQESSSALFSGGNGQVCVSFTG